MGRPVLHRSGVGDHELADHVDENAPRRAVEDEPVGIHNLRARRGVEPKGKDRHQSPVRHLAGCTFPEPVSSFIGGRRRGGEDAK